MSNAIGPTVTSRVETFEDGRGGQIAFRTRRVSAPVASLLFVHGLGDHSGWFEPLASAANGQGLNWYGLDLPGHGLSAGRRGHAAAFADLLRDVEGLRGVVSGSPGAGSADIPLFVGGHSMGGLVALRYAQERSEGLAGLLLVAPFLALAAHVPVWKRVVGRLANRLVPRLTLDNGLVPADLISDPDALAAHEADPLTHRRISARLWAEILGTQECVVEPAPLPALFQLAGDDRAVLTGTAEALCRNWEYPSRCVVYPGARHDLYHDRVARQVMADALNWISETI